MGLDDVAAKYLVEAGAIGIRRVSHGDISRIAKLTGATVVSTMATAEGEEVFEPSYLGECEEVCEEAVGDNDFIFFKQENSRIRKGSTGRRRLLGCPKHPPGGIRFALRQQRADRYLRIQRGSEHHSQDIGD
ncbi:unnamed protein product [Sphagnum balticum]